MKYENPEISQKIQLEGTMDAPIKASGHGSMIKYLPVPE